MTSEVVLPELGENIETADVSAVLVSVGDSIRRDQPLIEVETEKASLEVPAPVDGRVTALHVAAGDTIKVGQAILVLEGGTAVAQPEPSIVPVEAPAAVVASDGWACPLNLAPLAGDDETEAEKLSLALRQEMGQMRTWYDLAVEQPGARPVGASGLPADQLAEIDALLIHEAHVQTYREGLQLLIPLVGLGRAAGVA